MRQSELFTKTRREVQKDEESKNAKFLIRAGFIEKEMAGAYAFLPLGLAVLDKIIGIIREEMNAIGGQEMLLSSLQSPEVWKKTQRWDDTVIDVWFKTKLKNDAEIGLASTHEEALTELMKRYVSSYRDLPQYVYQFQTKFRNELRARSGLLRMREFIMKDLYSFSKSVEEHNVFYEKAKQAYIAIFNRIGIGEKTLLTFASGGSFSTYSHEFQTLCEAGEDTVYVCEKCRIAVNKEIIAEQHTCPQCKNKELQEQKAIEVGNIFSLGVKFSHALNLKFSDEKGAKQNVVMGCYGIGPARVMGTVVELFHDEKGILWPKAISPFNIHILALQGGEKEAEALYKELGKQNVEALYDDRIDTPAGEKFADADLIGIPLRVVVSKKTVDQRKVEIKKRNASESQLVDSKEVIGYMKAG